MSNGDHPLSGVNTSWKFLESFGSFPSGKMQHVALPSDIELVLLDFISTGSVEQSFSIDRSPIIFSFHLSGQAHGMLRHSPVRTEPVACGPGNACISFNPESSCKTILGDRQHYQIINIYIARRDLRKKLAGAYDQVPRDFRPVLENPGCRPYYRMTNMSPHIKMLADQLSQCPYKGALKILYMESKCVELIIRLLWELAQVPEHPPCQRLHPFDREQIHLARKMLLENLESPPTLKRLAGETGLNEAKLNRGFRQEYGMTVFEYYRMYRINRSKEILDQGRLNIDETAQFLGFYDTTHFIKQFKTHFGTTPGNYLKTAPPHN